MLLMQGIMQEALTLLLRRQVGGECLAEFMQIFGLMCRSSYQDFGNWANVCGQAVFDGLPTRFVDSEIGPVPEGWLVKSITQIATFLNGLALQKYPPRGDSRDLPVIKIAQLRKGSTEGAD